MKTLILLLAAALVLPTFASDFPAGSPKFGNSYETALATAKKEGKPIILVFSAVWCPPCQSMLKSVYPSAEVKPLQDKFVWAYLDVDDAETVKAGQKFAVEGIPHIQFLTSEGKAIDKSIGGLPPAEFAAELNKVLAKTK
jgi:thioredoxin-related protein